MKVFGGLAAVAVACTGVVGVLVGPAAHAALSASGGAPRSAVAGYYGTNHRVAQLEVTIVVPRVTCRSGEGLTDIDVVIGNQRQAAWGSIEIGCQGHGRANYGVSVFAGTGGAVTVPEENVRPGNRVVITVADRFHRMTAKATIAGRRPIRMSAKARSAAFLLVGAAVEGRNHAITGRVIDLRHAMLNGKPLGSAATLVRISETRHHKILLMATALRRDEAFMVKQP
jgi:hypothetical protein